LLFKPNTYVSVFNFPSEIASSYASVAAITNSWCANLEPRLRAKNGTRSLSSVTVRFFEISSSSSSKDDDKGEEEEEEEEEERAVLFAPLLSFLFLCLLLCLPFNITCIVFRVVLIRVVVFVLVVLVVDDDDDATKVATLLVVEIV
jgi:hypothetical protein